MKTERRRDESDVSLTPPNTFPYPSLPRPKCEGRVVTRRVGLLAAPHTPKGSTDERRSCAARNTEAELATRQVGRLTAPHASPPPPKGRTYGRQSCAIRSVETEQRHDESDISLTLPPTRPRTLIYAARNAEAEQRRHESDVSPHLTHRKEELAYIQVAPPEMCRRDSGASSATSH